MMKRYLVFVYDTYYPGGAGRDFLDSFDTEEEALAAGQKEIDKDISEWCCEWFDIIDTHTKKIWFGPTDNEEPSTWKNLPIPRED